MYTLSQVKTAFEQPSAAVGELNRLYHQRLGKHSYNPEGIDIFQEDWDTLLILDACRYDEFESCSDLPGDLEQRTSRGSMTREFVTANFSNRTLHDTVYVDSNGHIRKLQDEIGADLHNLIYVENDEYGNWSVLPGKVTDAARDADERHPDKRLIVHYMQPHHPFLGPTGRDFNYAKGFPETIKKNDVSRETVVEAYRENLELALDSIADLLPELRGKTVVTADHGELLGERQTPIPIRSYGHPKGVYVKELVDVPWLVHATGERKTVTADPPKREMDENHVAEIEDKLENLGYKGCVEPL